ncbi:MAG TPA: TlpA disulfide reductase family protein [Terriglobales bacterium]|nr:TlpA disulfide reductase family protein [Terriglobales bacterium]
MILKFSILLFIFGIFTVAAKAQDFVGSVRASLDRGAQDEATSKLQQYLQIRGMTPEYLEAYSWLGRAALARADYTGALAYADQTYQLCQQQIGRYRLTSEPRLQTALGAAIEVRGQALAKSGQTVQARHYLEAELAKYRGTGISARIQKNINLLGLEGAVAPELKLEPHLGPKPSPLSSLKGKPVVIFMWAHWCVDCKAQAPILARLKKDLDDQFEVVGATRLYGYAAAGTEATPQQEMEYIEAVRSKYFRILSDMPVPVATENFERYGASTTPTLVIIGPDTKVVRYHPGRMTYDELKTQLVPLIDASK